MKKHDFILKLFKGDDVLRRQLSTPGLIGDKVYATDAHCCIRFAKEKSGVDYSGNIEFPKEDTIFEDLGLDKEIIIPVDELLEKVYELEVKFDNDLEKCEKCDGEGESECECCQNESECKESEGQGIVEVDTPFAGLKLCGRDVEIFGKRVAPKVLYKVLEAAYLLRQDKMKVKYSSGKSKLLFEFDDIEIIVMTKYVLNPQE